MAGILEMRFREAETGTLVLRNAITSEKGRSVCYCFSASANLAGKGSEHLCSAVHAFHLSMIRTINFHHISLIT